MTAATAVAQAFIHARVGQHDLAVPVLNVVRAVELPATPLPVMPRRQGALAGLIDVDGIALPVVSLERWLPMGPPDKTQPQRVLVMATEAGMLGLVVDQVFEVQMVDARRMRQIHHEDGEGELFHSVIDPLGSAPILSQLDVDRLMHLCGIWCDGEGLGMPQERSALRAPPAKGKRAKAPHAVFRLDGEYWAVPAACVERVIATPSIELRLRPGSLAIGICQIDAVKMPLIAMWNAQEKGAVNAAKGWTAVLLSGNQRLGFMADECERVVELSDGDLAMAPESGLLRGAALLPDGMKLQVLNIENLFAAVPEAKLAVSTAISGPDPVAKAARAAHNLSHYLIFEADCEYAAPVDGGIVGVIDLSQQVVDDLRQHRRAVIPWRGRPCNVINMPPVNSRSKPFTPRLAVLVQGQDEQAPVIGIAIGSLRDWLPAHRADRTEMRLGSLGEFGLVTPRGTSSSLVVVDLTKMGYLVG